MAEGNPRLLTWGQDTLRLYELTEAGFVQVATTAITNGADDQYGWFPTIEFAFDSQQIVALSAISSSQTTAYQLSPVDLAVVHSADANLGSSYVRAAVGNGLKGVLAPTSIIAISAGGSEAGFNVDPSSSYGVSYRGVTSGVDAADGGLDFFQHLEISPDANFMTLANTDGLYISKAVISTNPHSSLDGSAATLLREGPCRHVAWTQNSIYMIACFDGAVQVYTVDEGNLTETSSVTEPTFGSPVRSAIASNGKIIAVVFDNAGTLTTIIYRRVAGFLQRLQEIVDFGQLLGFTDDGSILIDSAYRRAFRYDGTFTATSFTEDSTIMTNVPAGTLTQAISSHRAPGALGIGFLYNGAAADFFTSRVDMENLHFALLNAQATFAASDQDIEAILTNEVFGGNWPQGGNVLSNVSIVEGAQTVGLDCDDIRQVIYEGTISARYAVIFDNTSRKPLLFIDFQKEIEALQNTELTFQFDASGIVLFSA